MKKLVILAMICSGLTAFAQDYPVGNLYIKQSLNFLGKKITDISNDTTPSKSSNNLVTEFAAKSYAEKQGGDLQKALQKNNVDSLNDIIIKNSKVQKFVDTSAGAEYSTTLSSSGLDYIGFFKISTGFAIGRNKLSGGFGQRYGEYIGGLQWSETGDNFTLLKGQHSGSQQNFIIAGSDATSTTNYYYPSGLVRIYPGSPTFGNGVGNVLLAHNGTVAVGSVGIGVNVVHPSSVTEIYSKNKGLLIPRMTTQQRDSILRPIGSFNVVSGGSSYTNASISLSPTGLVASTYFVLSVISGIINAVVTTSTPRAVLTGGEYSTPPIVYINSTTGSGGAITCSLAPLPEGLQIYNTDVHAIQVYNASAWVTLGAGGGSAADSTNNTFTTKTQNDARYANLSHGHTTAQITGLDAQISSKENAVTAGTTGQYYRGDKSFQTLDKTAVGLTNVDNTSDVNKPVSTAQGTAIGLKLNSADSTIKYSSYKALQDSVFALKALLALKAGRSDSLNIIPNPVLIRPNDSTLQLRQTALDSLTNIQIVASNKENYLGLPSSNGQVLIGTTGGVRSWATMANNVTANNTWTGLNNDSAIIINQPPGTSGRMISPVYLGGVSSFYAQNLGGSYPNGTYYNIPLTGGSGTGATLGFDVVGGVVTNPFLVNSGTNTYKFQDVLSINNASIGGTGSGLALVVNRLTGTAYTPSLLRLRNWFIGYGASNDTTNFVLGGDANSLGSNRSGKYNYVINGPGGLSGLQSGIGNRAVNGIGILQNVNGGNGNTGYDDYAGSNVTTGNNNVFFHTGYVAAQAATMNQSMGIGTGAYTTRSNQLDIPYNEVQLRASTGVAINLPVVSNVQTAPTAALDVAAATISTASIRVRQGVAPTTPNAGDMYQDGVNVYMYVNGAWTTLNNYIRSSPSIQIIGTDANITAQPGTQLVLRSGVLTANRTIDVTALNTDKDYLLINNLEGNFSYTFTGQTVFYNDAVNAMTLLPKAVIILQRIDGKILITN